MAKDVASGWDHHWKAIISLYKRRKMLYSGLSEARAVATAEHLMLGHLIGLGSWWRQLEADISKPGEVFAQLLCCLSTDNEEAHAKALELLASLFDKLSTEDDPDLRHAVETALRLAMPLNPNHPSRAALSELSQRFPAIQSWSPDFLGESRGEEGLTSSTDSAKREEPQDSLRAMLEDHRVEPVHEREPSTRHVVMALGLAAKLGDLDAMTRLIALEDQYPEWVLPAYWLASTKPALERLYNALSVPYLAATASLVWQLMTGQKLDRQPALGVVGQKKKSGPFMPGLESAEQWWLQNANETGPWLDGKPVTVETLRNYLIHQCGGVTLPVWWLLQFEQRSATPDLVESWHRLRIERLQGVPRNDNGT